MQYLTFGGKVNNNNDRSRGTTQRYVVATTTCDWPTRFQRRHELFQATNPPTDGKMELTDSCVVFRTFGYRVVGLHGTHTLGGMVSDGLRGQGELKTAKLDDVSMCIHPGRMQQQQQQPVVVPTTTQQEVARLQSLALVELPIIPSVGRQITILLVGSSFVSDACCATLLWKRVCSTGFGWKITLTGGAHSIFSVASHHAHSNGVDFQRQRPTQRSPTSTFSQAPTRPSALKTEISSYQTVTCLC